jgi:LacI family transcriptional regulator, galactose operon repressor
MQSRARSIAIIYNATRVYDLKVMSGVAAYLQENENFSVYIEENALKDQRLPDLRSWSGDGIIANLDDPNVASAVAKTQLPVVGFGSGYGWYGQNSSIPYFFTNNQAVAKMAARHLLERGFRNFAYYGVPKTPVSGWSGERQIAFAEYLAKKGCKCETYRGRHTTPRQWDAMQRSLGKWLLSLPKPVGVMAANDSRARHVLEACRGVRLRVPEEVAVIGVDNHELLCRLSSPALSSIEQGARRIGYEAAKLLDRMMSGKGPLKRRTVIDPKGVVTRQSTDFMAIDDPLIAGAMAYIQQHAADGIKVPDVVRALAVSRSGLEMRFREVVGYTIHSAIRRVQLEKTRRLIAETNLPLKQIADTMGFKSVQHMTHLFGKMHGCSPAKYRHEVAL